MNTDKPNPTPGLFSHKDTKYTKVFHSHLKSNPTHRNRTQINADKQDLNLNCFNKIKETAGLGVNLVISEIICVLLKFNQWLIKKRRFNVINLN
jgi:hypothetical protein